MGWDDTDRVRLARYRDQWRAMANTAIKMLGKL
jgi:hypothetical protein